MQPVMSVNELIGSLPRIVAKKIWKVTDSTGKVVQHVSATDNRKSTAQRYIDNKYPGQTLTLAFAGTKGYITIPR
jgi:hypothetical protein